MEEKGQGSPGTLGMGFEGMPGFQLALRGWWKPLRVKEEVHGTDRARLGQGDEGRQAWGRSSGRDSRVFWGWVDMTTFLLAQSRLWESREEIPKQMEEE